MPRPVGLAGGKRTAAGMHVAARRLCRQEWLGNAHARHAGSAARGPAAARALGAAGALRPATGPGRNVQDGRAVPRWRTGQAAGEGRGEGGARGAPDPGQERPRAGAIGPARAARAPPAHGRSRLVPPGVFMRGRVCRRGGSRHRWRGRKRAIMLRCMSCRAPAKGRGLAPSGRHLRWPAQGRGASATAAAAPSLPPPSHAVPLAAARIPASRPYRLALRPSALSASSLSLRASEYPGCIFSALLRYLIALSGSPMSSSRRPMPAYAW